jgi:hypothetical protein
MHTPSSQSFTHIHSHTRTAERGVITGAESPEEILIARLIADLMVWIDSAWIIGLIRSHGALDIVGVFNGTGDPALRPGYIESVSICTHAEKAAGIDAQLRRHNRVGVFLPVEADGQLSAALAIGPKNKNQRYSASDISLIRDLGAKIGKFLRAQTDDFHIERSIQDRLLTSRLPRFSVIECSAQCERSTGFGGDFFDCSDSSAAGLIASIGNVAVAGQTGSMLMTGVQAYLRSVGRHGAGLPELFGEVNRMFWEIGPENASATLFSARVCPGREQLLYINAGHQTSLIVRRSGRIDRLEPNAPVLGLSRGSAYRQRIAPFEPGDTLIAVGDAITEPAAGTDIAGCEAALIRMVQHDRGLRLRELPARMIDLIESFAGAQVLDRTVVVVHLRNTPGGDANRQLHAPIKQFAAAAA